MVAVGNKDVRQANIRIPCQVWARVVGFIRPLDNWNDGKKAEYAERKTFRYPRADQMGDE